MDRAVAAAAARARRKAGAGPGLRERNKLDKRQRIRAAAAELFARLGYGAATMRQIAKRAHVGLGTLFNYAEDKRDLVFLIFNDELDALTRAALAAPKPDEPLIEQLMEVFACHYRRLAENHALSRILLQELTFYSTGKQAATFQDIRARLIDGLEALVRSAQADGRILAREEAALIARHLFFVYSAAIRWWITAPHPDLKEGLAELRRLLELQFSGLAPAAAGGRRRRGAAPAAAGG
jgi:TetR/AcrR family transcriptional regulator